MRNRPLALRLHQIVQLTLASSVGIAAAACSTSTSSPVTNGGGAAVTPVQTEEDAAAPSPFDDPATFSCTTPLPDVVSNLRPAVPVDYVALRLLPGEPLDPDGGLPPATTGASHGTPCATATDPSACNGALSAATIASLNEGWTTSGDPFTGYVAEIAYLVFTRGDEVGVVRGLELPGFLGEIDTLEEARLLLQAYGRINFECKPDSSNGWKRADDGSWLFLVNGAGCGGLIPYRAEQRVAPDGTLSGRFSNDGRPNSCGRRPDGLRSTTAAPAGSKIGEHFARMAHLEAASVIAFRRLEMELVRFGAPVDLIDRACASRADEIVHARDTALVARRFGAEVPKVEVEPMRIRSLLEIAVENAVEGCVRETYGALEAGVQAAQADAEFRPLMQKIAADEARHAELAHDVAAWIETRLSSEERAIVAQARAAALEELRAEMERTIGDEDRRALGLPTLEQARRLVDGLGGVVLDLAA
jgi:hypothetical protein